jgi:dipeptidyl aminopeptidase/acylaminoacyl peptidase
MDMSIHGEEIFLTLIPSNVLKMNVTSHPIRPLIAGTILLLTVSLQAQGLKPDQLLSLKSADGVEISPDGLEYLYAVTTPRGPNDMPGAPRTTWYRGSVKGGAAMPLFFYGYNASEVRYSPDGDWIGFLHSAWKEPRQVWIRKVDGGDPIRLTDEPAGVSYFRWHPGSGGIAYLSTDPESEREKELKERGYDFIYYEENLKKNHLTLMWFDDRWKELEKKVLEMEGHPWDFEFSPTGNLIAASVSPENLIDQRYMFRKIHLIDPSTETHQIASRNEGKL